MSKFVEKFKRGMEDDSNYPTCDRNPKEADYERLHRTSGIYQQYDGLMNKKINQNLYNKGSRNYQIKEDGVVLKTDDANNRATKRIKFDLNLEDSDRMKPKANSNGVISILINYKPRLKKKKTE